MTSVLNSAQIRQLIGQTPPLVSAYVDLDRQLQPAGIDLTLRQVAVFAGRGKITRDNKYRRVSDLGSLHFDAGGYLSLSPGPYMITYNEAVNLPLNVMALALPRSSLLRSGVTVHTAVWDPGYSGRAQSLLNVINPAGFMIEKDASIVQLVFFNLDAVPLGYQGDYQGENLE